MLPRWPVLLAAAWLQVAASTAGAVPYRFADLAWRTPRGDAHRALLGQGFCLVRQVGYGDLMYGGTLNGDQARVTLKFDPLGRLVAVDARTLPDEADLLTAYDRVKAALTRQYGTAVYSLTSFRPPYREGDGRALEALKSGHAIFDTVWFDKHELNPAARSGVQLEVVRAPFSRLEVRQFYLAQEWTDEYRRRSGESEGSP